MGVPAEEQAWEWVNRNCATVSCNWTTPGAWTVTTYYADALLMNTWSRETPLEAVMAAMRFEEPDPPDFFEVRDEISVDWG